MSRMSFEMCQYRHVLVRLRQGDSDRDIARSRLMGRPKVAALRGLAVTHGWLALEAPLPDDATLSAAIGQARRVRSTISTVEPYRAQVERWAAEGVGGIAIDAALSRDHGYRGSYSAVRRMTAGIRASLPPEATGYGRSTAPIAWSSKGHPEEVPRSLRPPVNRLLPALPNPPILNPTGMPVFHT